MNRSLLAPALLLSSAVLLHRAIPPSPSGHLASEVAALRSELDALKSQPAPVAPSWGGIAQVAASLAAPRTMAALAPILPARISGGGGAYGNKIHPASSTDNAIARFDGTTGDLQNSAAIVEDDGDLVLAAGDALRFADDNVGLIESGTDDLDIRADNEVAGTWSGSGLSLSAGNAFTSTGSVGSGGTVNGVETDYLVADFVATDTTPLDVTGISFTLDINDTYAIECIGTVQLALASAGGELGLDIPAGASVAATCAASDSTGVVDVVNFVTDDGRCITGSGVAAFPGYYGMSAVVTMSSTAGDTKLRLRSETTDDATIKAGFRCSAKKIVDN